MVKELATNWDTLSSSYKTGDTAYTAALEAFVNPTTADFTGENKVGPKLAAAIKKLTDAFGTKGVVGALVPADKKDSRTDNPELYKVW